MSSRKNDRPNRFRSGASRRLLSKRVNMANFDW